MKKPRYILKQECCGHECYVGAYSNASKNPLDINTDLCFKTAKKACKTAEKLLKGDRYSIYTLYEIAPNNTLIKIDWVD